MRNGLLLILGIVLSAGAQLLIKQGVNGLHLEPSRPWAAMGSWQVAGGALLYLLAFIVYMHILAVVDITVASPMMVAGVMLLVFLGGLAMGEPVSTQRLAGAVLLIAGVALITRST